MIKPFLDHISIKTFRKVYEPDSDSFCLMDAIESDVACLERIRPRAVLDVGSGSGVLSAHLALLLRGKSLPVPHFVCVDRNPDAAVTTLSTLGANGCRSGVSVLRGDITNSAVLQRMKGHFDVIIFNPPYVPTELCEIEGDGIEVSCAGGPGGTYVLEKALPNIIPLLSSRGVFYLLFIEQNGPIEAAESICHEWGLEGEAIFKRFSGERYTIFRFRHRRITVTKST